MLKKIGAVLTAKWFITLIGVIILSLLIWFLGPLLGFGEMRPLGGQIARLITIFVILALWALFTVIGLLRQKRSNDRMMEDLAEAQDAGPSAQSVASAEEVAIIQERAQEALTQLKKAKLGGASGRQYLYQLPWYIFIGPPGSGKTTALVNCGLKFPLADRVGGKEVKDVGGTRNCDWFFTDEAVLIDTAGRYTTQDSHQAVDAAAWTGFLEMLKKNRPRQPINGALIAISLADMAIMTESEREEHARAIKSRIRELYETLGVRFPIYVLFTKADLIAGFVEFFDDLGREDREQVWGMTLEFDDIKGSEGVVGAFGQEFDLLVGRLNDRLTERLHHESDLQRRSLIYGFPPQVASLKRPAQEFLDEIFRPSRFEERPLLRGIYLTSGTQEGKPIDRLMGAMAATFGLNRQSLAAFSGSGRSYFLTRLLREVVFPEASIVSANRRVEALRRWSQRVAYTLAILLVLGMAGAWANSYLANRNLIDDYEAGIRQYNEQVQALEGQGISLTNVQDFDLRVVQPLATLRDLPAGYAQRDDGAPLLHTLGLYQGDALGARSIVSYRDALNSVLLPRLLFRLTEQLRAQVTNTDYVYEALKVYLILGGLGPMNEDLVREWMAIDWDDALLGQGNAAIRQELMGHLDAMLEMAPLEPIGLDGPLIQSAQQTLTRLPLAERGYALITTSREATGLPMWRVIDVAGPTASRALFRPSGAPLSDGVEGIYTYNGFHDVFLPALADVSRFVAEESWVLGSQSEVTTDNAQLTRLQIDVLQLYLDDYKNRWSGILGDFTIVPFAGDLDMARQVMSTLQGQNSPFRKLLQGIATETRLTAEPPVAEGVALENVEGLGDAGAEVGRIAVARAGLGRLAGIVGRVGIAEGGGPGGPPWQDVDDHFKWLHDYVGTGDGAAPIDTTVAQFGDIASKIDQAALAPNRDQALAQLAQGGLTQQMRLALGGVPGPLGQSLGNVADDISAITVGSTRARLSSEWQANVLQLCNRALGNRYPLYRNSQTDVTLDDFTRLFGPGGLIDNFFNNNLLSYVDVSRRPWRWLQVDNASLGISNGVLAQFQNAAMIRDALFLGGGGPSVSFELMPVSLDANATQVLLNIDGQELSYAHGPPRPQRMQWPGPGPTQVRLAFSPALPGQASTINLTGPWSFFRLLDSGTVQPSAQPDRLTVTFFVGGRSATFELRANSVLNPFTMRELGRFRCPQAF